MQLVHSAPQALGLFGAGASKKDAHDKWNQVGTLIDEVKSAIQNHPKAAAAVNGWGQIVPVEQQFYKDRQYVYDSSRFITDWDKYITQADVYADKFRAIIGSIIAKAGEIGEQSLSANYKPPDLGDESGGDNTMLYVGLGVALVAAIGLSIYLNRPKTAVAGLRRRRRRR